MASPPAERRPVRAWPLILVVLWGLAVSAWAAGRVRELAGWYTLAVLPVDETRRFEVRGRVGRSLALLYVLRDGRRTLWYTRSTYREDNRTQLDLHASLPQGLLLVDQGHRHLEAVDLETGEVRWTRDASYPLHGLGDERLPELFAIAGQRLQQLDPHTGETVLEVVVPGNQLPVSRLDVGRDELISFRGATLAWRVDLDDGLHVRSLLPCWFDDGQDPYGLDALSRRTTARNQPVACRRRGDVTLLVDGALVYWLDTENRPLEAIPLMERRAHELTGIRQVWEGEPRFLFFAPDREVVIVDVAKRRIHGVVDLPMRGADVVPTYGSPDRVYVAIEDLSRSLGNRRVVLALDPATGEITGAVGLWPGTGEPALERVGDVLWLDSLRFDAATLEPLDDTWHEIVDLRGRFVRREVPRRSAMVERPLALTVEASSSRDDHPVGNLIDGVAHPVVGVFASWVPSADDPDPTLIVRLERARSLQWLALTAPTPLPALRVEAWQDGRYRTVAELGRAAFPRSRTVIELEGVRTDRLRVTGFRSFGPLGGAINEIELR